MPADVPRLAQIGVNERLLGFTAGLVLLTALAFGCAPAVRILRQDVNGPLTRGQRAGDTVAQQRLRRTLVAAEVALALVLLVGAGLLVQSFVRLVNVDLGFAPQNTVALQVFHYGEDGNEATPSFFRETLEGIRALPGVAAAGAVSGFPLGLADLTAQSPLTLHARPPPPPGEEPSTAVAMATPAYLETMRIPLRAGRWFDERDDAERPAVAGVNETLARQHWPDGDILPSFTAIGWERLNPASGTVVDRGADPEIGLNVEYGITSNLTANFTGNPDFSQIESDLPPILVMLQEMAR